MNIPKTQGHHIAKPKSRTIRRTPVAKSALPIEKPNIDAEPSSDKPLSEVTEHTHSEQTVSKPSPVATKDHQTPHHTGKRHIHRPRRQTQQLEASTTHDEQTTSSNVNHSQQSTDTHAVPQDTTTDTHQNVQAHEVKQSSATSANEVGPQTRHLTLLGNKTVYSDHYTPAILEAFENRHPENDYFVKFNCPEFTSLCPITGQPDFATIYISYIPDRKMVESKSLKLYLFSFRNHGAFHEDCVNIIMKDLIKLMSPRYIEVWGKFLPRGGLSIDPYANYGRPTTRWEEFARQRLLMHDLAPERIDNR